MRILFITHYPGLLGANRSLLDLIEGLASYQVEAVVLCPAKGRLTEVLAQKGIPFIIISYTYWGGALLEDV